MPLQMRKLRLGEVETCLRLTMSEYRTGIQIQACLTSIVTMEERK